MSDNPKTTQDKLKIELEKYAATLVEFSSQLSEIAETENITSEQVDSFLFSYLKEAFGMRLAAPDSRRELGELITRYSDELAAAEPDDETDDTPPNIITARAETIYMQHGGETDYGTCVMLAETSIAEEINEASALAAQAQDDGGEK